VNTITKTEYQALVGLKALSDRLQKQREELELAVREITGEGDYSYHATDFVYGDGSLKIMLQRLDITVADGLDRPTHWMPMPAPPSSGAQHG
jgi:hypothetical protein